MIQYNWFLIFFIFFCSSGVESGSVEKHDVIIVGSGAAGLAAATKLIKNGKDLVILEARDRIGGRINTAGLDGSIVDLGAEFIHGTDGNRVYETVKTFVELFKDDERRKETTCIKDSSGKDYDLLKLRKLLELNEATNIERFENQTLEEAVIPPFEDFLRSQSVPEEEVDVYKDAGNKVLNSLFGGTVKEATALIGYDHIGGGDSCWNQGYKMFLDVLMEKYPPESKDLGVETKVRFGKEVEEVDWSGELVKISCQDGSRYLASQVLLTLPLGYLKAAPSSFFKPPLPPKKQDAIKYLGMGKNSKIFLKYENLDWLSRASCEGGYLFGMHSKEALKFASQHSKFGWASNISIISYPCNTNNVVTFWVSGEHTAEVEEASDEEVITGIREILKLMLPDTDVPRPINIIRSKWVTDPLTFGTYSFYSAEAVKHGVQASDLAEPLYGDNQFPKVLFAGEATSSKHFSTVHGATETGFREADRILS